MQFFKNQSGVVFSFADGTVPPAHLALVAMSPAEIDTHLNQQPTPEQFQAMVGAAVDEMLDELAQSWRYRNYISARSYKGDLNPRFAAEADALIAHGSACWTVLDDLEVAVLAGTAQMPGSVKDVLALLPDPPSRPTV